MSQHSAIIYKFIVRLSVIVMAACVYNPEADIFCSGASSLYLNICTAKMICVVSEISSSQNLARHGQVKQVVSLKDVLVLVVRS